MKTLILILLVLCAMAPAAGKDAWAREGEDAAPSGDDLVLLASTGIGVPLGRIVLVRKASAYCAVRFTEFWAAKTVKERYKGKDWWAYARYEAWYQDDGTGDFSKENVKAKEDELIDARHFAIGRLVLGLGGDRGEIECDPIKLIWSQHKTEYAVVHFYKGGMGTFPDRIKEYGIELAPTPWKSISEVNVKDPRIQWYVYDEKRVRERIPVDRLWEEKRGATGVAGDDRK